MTIINPELTIRALADKLGAEEIARIDEEQGILWTQPDKHKIYGQHIEAINVISIEYMCEYSDGTFEMTDIREMAEADESQWTAKYNVLVKVIAHNKLSESEIEDIEMEISMLADEQYNKKP